MVSGDSIPWRSRTTFASMGGAAWLCVGLSVTGHSCPMQFSGLGCAGGALMLWTRCTSSPRRHSTEAWLNPRRISNDRKRLRG